MTRRDKLQVLLLSGIAVMAIILLSAGLSKLEFSLGQPFSFVGKRSVVVMRGIRVEGLVRVLGEVLLFLAQLFLPFAIIYFIISPKVRKQMRRRLVGLLFGVLVLYVLMRTRPNFFTREDEMQPPDMSPLGEVGSAVESVADSSQRLVADPPQWLVSVMTIGLTVAVVGIIWFIWRRSRRPAGLLEQLAQEAQDALEALQAGASLKNTVMRCYFEMCQIVSEQRGIKREKTMTPREFERYLGEAGLPDEQVQQLTRLFEGVRYGTRAPGENEERQAITCLTAIVTACKSSP
jgi:hypothetical protein